MGVALYDTIHVQVSIIITINLQEEHVEDDGTRVILFPNGTKKMVSMDGLTSTVYFFNGDIKRIMSDGTIVSKSS